MPQRESYRHGVPSWVDLASPDMAASKAFYEAVLGWGCDDASSEEMGGYAFFTQDGKLIAGVAPIMSEGQPPVWSTYVNVDDCDSVFDAALANGAAAVVAPMDVMEAGRMAFFVDPQGAALGLWQPREHKGAQLVNEPNSLCWNEVFTGDVEASKAFYAAVFGWTFETNDMGGSDYTVFKVGDDGVGGIMAFQPRMIEQGVPPMWAVSFAVADAAAVCETARAHGATIAVEPMEIPIGAMAVIVDPQGAAFQVIAMTGQPGDQDTTDE